MMQIELSPALWTLIVLAAIVLGNVAIGALKRRGYDRTAEVLRTVLPLAFAAFPRAPAVPPEAFPDSGHPDALKTKTDALEGVALRPPSSSVPPPLPVLVMALAMIGCAGLQEIPRVVERQAEILTRIEPALIETKKVALAECASDTKCRDDVKALFDSLADLYDLSRELFCAHSEEPCK